MSAFSAGASTVDECHIEVASWMRSKLVPRPPRCIAAPALPPPAAVPAQGHGLTRGRVLVAPFRSHSPCGSGVGRNPLETGEPLRAAPPSAWENRQQRRGDPGVALRVRVHAGDWTSLDCVTLYSHFDGTPVNATPAMTVRDVAGYLKVDEKTVYRLAKRGRLPGFKVAGTWRFKKQDIDNWIEHQKADAAQARTGGKGSG
jgi:excisionase family DNA binding protein